jgi:hypothetical protein
MLTVLWQRCQMLRKSKTEFNGIGGLRLMPSSAIDARPPTLALLAGSQPAVTKLASLPRIHQRSRHQSRRATPRSLVHTDVSDHAWPQADRGNRYNPASASPNPRQNPHSARGTAPAYVPRFRALALFGRRPQERVEGFVMPASKNLHNTDMPMSAQKEKSRLTAASQFNCDDLGSRGH